MSLPRPLSHENHRYMPLSLLLRLLSLPLFLLQRRSTRQLGAMTQKRGATSQKRGATSIGTPTPRHCDSPTQRTPHQNHTTPACGIPGASQCVLGCSWSSSDPSLHVSLFTHHCVAQNNMRPQPSRDGRMGASAGDEEEGNEEPEYVFAAGTSRQAFHHLATAGGDREDRPAIR